MVSSWRARSRETPSVSPTAVRLRGCPSSPYLLDSTVAPLSCRAAQCLGQPAPGVVPRGYLGRVIGARICHQLSPLETLIPDRSLQRYHRLQDAPHRGEVVLRPA